MALQHYQSHLERGQLTYPRFKMAQKFREKRPPSKKVLRDMEKSDSVYQFVVWKIMG